MPKKIMPRVEPGLPTKAPARLDAKERAVYARLRTQLVEAGYDSRTGLETLVVAVRQVARAERLADQVAKLPDWTVEGSTGQLTIHPLVRELRSVEAAVKTSLGQLLLTPRSQSVSRVDQAPQVANPADDCVVRLLGG